jgi:hypothetical protein
MKEAAMREWFLANINSAVIVAALGAVQVILTIINTRYSRRMRDESSREHQATQAKNKQAIDTLATKVAVEADRMAEKVEVTTASIAAKLDENTAISTDAVVQAAKAYEEANNVNQKIASLEKYNAGREERRDVGGSPAPHNRRAGDVDVK